jgi:hypothetical protein
MHIKITKKKKNVQSTLNIQKFKSKIVMIVMIIAQYKRILKTHICKLDKKMKRKLMKPVKNYKKN